MMQMAGYLMSRARPAARRGNGTMKTRGRKKSNSEAVKKKVWEDSPDIYGKRAKGAFWVATVVVVWRGVCLVLMGETRQKRLN